MNQLFVLTWVKLWLPYQGVPLNWSQHYEPALKLALSKWPLILMPGELALATSILSFYNTRTSPSVV